VPPRSSFVAPSAEGVIVVTGEGLKLFCLQATALAALRPPPNENTTEAVIRRIPADRHVVMLFWAK
jgi:hypothetical protein